tara:strand:- start:412 stop:675 length:264 start_codon:yes stop_codon:yes gene_type:complete
MKKVLTVLAVVVLFASCEKESTDKECNVGTISVVNNNHYTYYPEEKEVSFYLVNNCSGNVQEYKVPSDSLFDIKSFMGSELTLNNPW